MTHNFMSMLYSSCSFGNTVLLLLRLLLRRDVKAIFTDWRHGFYQHNKLANVYTAFEMQRRCVYDRASRWW